MLAQERQRALGRIFEVAVVPLLLGLAAAAAFLAIRKAWNLDAVIAGTVVFTLLYLHVFERLIPLNPEWRAAASDAPADGFHLVAVSLFSALGAIAAASAAIHLVDWMHLELHWWRRLPFLVAFLLASVLGEFLPYWYHRLSHAADARFPASVLLWRIHSIHHIPPKLNLFKTNWMHPVNTFINAFAKMFPLFVLGFGKEIVFSVALLNVVVSYVSHANISARTGVLDYLITTPHVHHFHHSTRLEEAKNYANNLPFWDLVGGTYFRVRRPVAQVGIQRSAESDYPATAEVWQQMRFPFRAAILSG